jgi:Tat protein translocase TatB subunit
MPEIGPMEILMVAAIALIVFGPEKLPQIARSIGRQASELRRMASEVKDEFQAGLDLEDEDEEPEPKPKFSRRPHPNELAAPPPTTPSREGRDTEAAAGQPAPESPAPAEVAATNASLDAEEPAPETTAAAEVGPANASTEAEESAPESPAPGKGAGELPPRAVGDDRP